jgi:sulfate adenylyltransferase
VLSGEAAAEAARRVGELPQAALREDSVNDLNNLAHGLFSPLEGFMGKADYEGVVRQKRLSNGLPWTIPVLLDADEETATGLSEGAEVALVSADGKTVGILHLEEKYRYDPKEFAANVFRTTDTAHPGVAGVFRMGPVLLGGKVSLIASPADPFARWNLSPAETRVLFRERGWKRVVAFQTRNPVHRAHEYLIKCALETVDGALLHPLVGQTKEGDIPAEVRMQCYEVLLDHYFPRARVALSVMPVNMRYAGPTEAIFHAIVRRNYGCTHFIVGRDHAGVGNYYGTYEAQEIFDEFEPEEIGIVPLRFEHSFFCRLCGGMATAKTCPHGKESHVFLSGTKVRELLEQGQSLPAEFTRPEVAEVLLKAARSEAVGAEPSGMEDGHCDPANEAAIVARLTRLGYLPAAS